jgi:hypothetical protein
MEERYRPAPVARLEIHPFSDEFRRAVAFLRLDRLVS